MKINTFEQIRSVLGDPHPKLEKKIYSQLNDAMTRFICKSPLVFLSTADTDGYPTISPKGDAPGFIKLDGNQTLLIPERKGNKLAFTFKNILSGSKVGLIFVVPGTAEVLRVHGCAEIIQDPQLNAELASKSQPAILVTKVTVSTCYFHCGKALLRSDIFNSRSNYQDMGVSFGRELVENNALNSQQAIEFDQGVQSRYKTDL